MRRYQQQVIIKMIKLFNKKYIPVGAEICKYKTGKKYNLIII